MFVSTIHCEYIDEAVICSIALAVQAHRLIKAFTGNLATRERMLTHVCWSCGHLKTFWNVYCFDVDIFWFSVRIL